MTARTTLDGELPAEQAVTSAAYRLFILLVTLNALVVALLYYVSIFVPAIPPAVRQVFALADTIHATIFLFDFLLQLKRAPHRRHYLVHWGWLDLITGLPGPPFLRLLRVVRLAQVTRAQLRNTPMDVRLAARHRLAQSTLLVVAMLVLLVVTYGSAAIVMVEADAPGANITSGGDAIWWAFVTIATVGYGDTYPVTAWGRLIGVAMLVAGVSLFSVLTSFLASTFLKPAEHGDEIRDRILHAKLAELQQAVRDLEARLVERDSR
jgi:voltage-gated potassium channel